MIFISVLDLYFRGIQERISDIIDKLPDLSGDKIPVVMASEADIATMQDDIALIKADVATLKGAISGSEAQVDVVSLPALPDTSAGDLAKITTLDTKLGDVSKAEDAVHSSGDKGIMMLGVRKDSATAIATSDGDYIPPTFDANGAMWVQLAGVLSHLIDSIDVAKMSKGAVTTVHSDITATATSAEVDCRGFNSLIVHWVSSATDKTWTISVTGATASGLTFVPLLDKTTGLAASEITTDISGFFVISNIPDYIKIVATEVDDGATVTCKVQPFNG